jgi:hypothetical protein
MSDSNFLRKLVASMPRRLVEVTEKDGCTTHAALYTGRRN